MYSFKRMKPFVEWSKQLICIIRLPPLAWAIFNASKEIAGVISSWQTITLASAMTWAAFFKSLEFRSKFAPATITIKFSPKNKCEILEWLKLNNKILLTPWHIWFLIGFFSTIKLIACRFLRAVYVRNPSLHREMVRRPG